MEITLDSVCTELHNIIPQDKHGFETDKLDDEVIDAAFLCKFKETLDYFCASKWDHCYMYSNALLDMNWEHLNTGHWKDVAVEWRFSYAFLSLFKAICEFVQFKRTAKKENLSNAIRTCDMGLLMGAPVNNNILTKLVAQFQNLYADQFSDPNDLPTTSKKKVKTTDLPIINLENVMKRKQNPSLEDFKNNHMDKEEPVVLEGAIDYWPAFGERKWSLNYIKAVAGCRTVPIELGSKYTDDSWSQKLLTIQEFVENYIENKNADTPVGYLAQHQLFDQIPELQKDISVPTYCSLTSDESDEEDVDINAWFGPQGTVSPLHHDPKHNLLAQVVGTKYIKLYSQDQTEYLYPHEGLLSNTSLVDVENVDLQKFPKFEKARSLECILGPGDLLYIPPKCWHYVRSLEISFSVSFWWK